MKTLIIAVNSKYIHSALAPWYLKVSCSAGCGEVSVAEYTINEQPDDVLSSIYLQKPDVAAFSCYIWNISYILKVADSLKKVLPGITIILGGPEVSYDTRELLEKHLFIDYILSGEGEHSLPELLRCIAGGRQAAEDPEAAKDAGAVEDAGVVEQAGAAEDAGAVQEAGAAEQTANQDVLSRNLSLSHPDGCIHIEGLSWRSKYGIVTGGPVMAEKLDSIPSPYTDEMLKTLNNKIAYYESSRGCPFSCSYCLSSASDGTRYFSLNRVFTELDRIAASGVRQIKFVDRTFNANKERAKKIIRHILELEKSGQVCNFHFEVGADLFDEEIMQLLENAPKGLIQLEAGVQTANEKSLSAVCRKTDLSRLFGNLIRLKKNNNVHIHADLIAGLPHEDYNSFAASFDIVYGTRPHQLQLGFLKLLKGTSLRGESDKFGFVFRHYPPYEILTGNDISFDELIVLKGIAELVERFYNSGRFLYSLDFVIEKSLKTPFDFYEGFYEYHKSNGLLDRNLGVKELFYIFERFASMYLSGADKQLFLELLRLDFLSCDNSGTLPDFLRRQPEPGFSDKCHEIARDTERITAMLPEAAGMPYKQLLNKVCFEKLLLNSGDGSPAGVPAGDGSAKWFTFSARGSIVLFGYLSRDKVTGRYPFFILDTNV